MKKNPWLVFLAVFMISIAIVMAQFKVPPIMGGLIGQYQLDKVSAGWLMSIFSVAAIILAFPGAFILRKLGPRKSGLISVGTAFVGTLIGVFAPNFQVLMLSRVIEGIGLGLIAVIAPYVIASVFPPEKRGLPMGIWAAWYPCGISIIFAIAPNLDRAFGRQGVWLFTAAFMFVALILYALFVYDQEQEAPAGETAQQPRFFDGLKYSGVWILALTFFLFNIGQQGYQSWGPTYFIEALGVEPAMASYYISIQTIISIFAAAFAGWLTDRVHNKKIMLTAVYVLLAVIWAFSFNLTPSMILPYMVILGIVTVCAPTVTWTMVPRAVPNMAMAGVAIALANFSSQLGTLASPPALGAIFETYGSWSVCSTFMAGAGVIAFIAMLFYPKAKAKTVAQTGEVAKGVQS